MALMPTLGKQILEELNVEDVTHELQMKSKAPRTPSEPRPPPSESSVASNDPLHELDSRSDMESASASSFSYQGEGGESSNIEESSQSWDHFSAQSSQPSGSRRPSLARPETDSTDFLAEAQLSDSITTASSALSYVNGSGLVSAFCRPA